MKTRFDDVMTQRERRLYATLRQAVAILEDAESAEEAEFYLWTIAKSSAELRRIMGRDLLESRPIPKARPLADSIE